MYKDTKNNNGEIRMYHNPSKMSLCTQSNTSIKTTSYWHHGRRSDLRLTPDWRTWCQYDVVLTLYQNGIVFTSCVSIRRQIDAYDVILMSIVLKIFERFRVSIWHYIDVIKCVDPTSDWRIRVRSPSAVHQNENLLNVYPPKLFTNVVSQVG